MPRPESDELGRLRPNIKEAAVRAILNSPFWSFRELLLILMVTICIDRLAMADKEDPSMPLPAPTAIVLENKEAQNPHVSKASPFSLNH